MGRQKRFRYARTCRKLPHTLEQKQRQQQCRWDGRTGTVQIRNKDIRVGCTHTEEQKGRQQKTRGWNADQIQMRYIREVREKRSVVLKTKPLTPPKMCRHLDFASRKMNKSMAAQKT